MDEHIKVKWNKEVTSVFTIRPFGLKRFESRALPEDKRAGPRKRCRGLWIVLSWQDRVYGVLNVLAKARIWSGRIYSTHFQNLRWTTRLQTP